MTPAGGIDPIRPITEPVFRTLRREHDEEPRKRQDEQPQQEDETREDSAPADGLPHIDIRA